MLKNNIEPTQKGESTTCAECGNPNPGDRRYCGHCGKRLWEPCADCQTPNATTVEYCGNCGANLKQRFAQQVAEIQAKRRRSHQLEAEGRYLEAMAELRGVRTGNDTRLVELTSDVAGELERLAAERDARIKEVEGTLQKAEQLVASNLYTAAYETLQAVPPGLRTAAGNDLLTRCEAAVAEIRELTGRVRAGLKQRQFAGMADVVRRLLELKPDDPKLPQLLEQLLTRQAAEATSRATTILSQASEQFKQGKYEHAADLLTEIDPDQVPKSHRAAFDTIHDVAWCLRFVREEPFVSRHMLTAARRWHKARPKDTTAARLVSDLSQRLATEARRSPTVFARPKHKATKPQSIGLELTWWRGWTQFDVDQDCEPLRQTPSRFHAAVGLALQGVGHGTLVHNLMPTTKSLLGQLGIRRRGNDQAAWGLDFGSTGLKAVRVERLKGEARLRITHAAFLPMSGDDDESDAADRLRSLVEQLVDEQSIEEPISAVLGLSGPKSLGRTFRIPKFKNAKKAEEAIEFETKRQIPINADSIYFDWHVWPVSDDQHEAHVTLLAARRGHVQQLIDACSDTPLNIAAVQSVCLSLYNAALAEFFPSRDKASAEDAAARDCKRGLALLDLGHQSSTLVVVTPDLVRYRSIPIGTDRLDRKLVERYKVTAEKAISIRLDPNSAPRLYQLDQLVTQLYTDLALDVLRTLRTYELEGIDVARLVVTGGAADLMGVFRCLAQVKA